MGAIFNAHSDATPYTAIAPKISLDETNPPLKALRGRQRWAAEQSMAMNWSHVDDIREDALNRILWWDAKGFNAPYPNLRRPKHERDTDR
jgi:hypothetical protein